jgi:hypothetical protein
VEGVEVEARGGEEVFVGVMEEKRLEARIQRPDKEDGGMDISDYWRLNLLPLDRWRC